MSGRSLGIAEAIENLRSELEKAAKLSENKALRFSAQEIELELALVADNSIRGEGGVSIFVVDANIEGSESTSIAHRVKLTLRPERPEVGNERSKSPPRRGERTDLRVSGKK